MTRANAETVVLIFAAHFRIRHLSFGSGVQHRLIETLRAEGPILAESHAAIDAHFACACFGCDLLAEPELRVLLPNVRTRLYVLRNMFDLGQVSIRGRSQRGIIGLAAREFRS